VPLAIQGFQRRHTVPFVAEIRVGIILENGDLVALGQLQQMVSALEAHDRTGWILVGRQCVDQLRSLALEDSGQDIGAHAVRIGGHPDELGTGRTKDLQGADIGRILDHDRVPRIEKNSRRQVQTGLGSR